MARSRRRVVRAWTGTAVLAGAVAIGCGPTAAVEPGPRPIVRIATAFAPFSQPLAAEYRSSLPQFDIESQPAGDSEAAIAGIEAGTVDLGVVLADASYLAYRRDLERTPGADSRIRGVALLQPLPQYVLVRGGSGIHDVSDLRKPTVGPASIALGPLGSSSALIGQLVLEAFDVDPAKIAHVTTRDEAAAGLKDGTFEATFLPGYVYPDTVIHSVVEAGAYLIPIDGPAVDRLRQEHPFVQIARIPREVYPGQDRILPTVGIDLAVVCRRDLDPSIVYALTSTLMSAYPRLSSVEATLRFLNPEEAPATPVPLHPGAARYFRQRELLR